MPETYDDAMDNVLNELFDLLIAKHHDYGTANLLKFGEHGIIVRASDKLARLENLLSSAPRVRDENFEKTWLDLAGYAIQAVLLIRGQLTLPVEEEHEDSGSTQETSLPDLILRLSGVGKEDTGNYFNPSWYR